MVELNFEDIPGLPYKPFRPDGACYPDRHAEVGGKARNDVKQPYVDFGTKRHEDKERYTSPEVAAREWERLWKKTWVLFGHSGDLPQKGSYQKVDIGPESFIVVRQADGSIRALYNVCQHRGTPLVTDEFGIRGSFTCPYHLWQFDLAGRCARITDRETFRTEALAYDLDIPSVRVEEWKGWLFLTMNRDARPLNQFLGDTLTAQLDAYPWERMRRLVDMRQVWEVNWKIGMEAFIEGYHTQALHPQMAGYVDLYHSQIDVYPNGHARQIVPYMRPYPQFAKRAGDRLLDEHKVFLRDAGIDPESFTGGPRDVRPAIIAAKRGHAQGQGLDFSRFDDEQLVDDWTVQIFPAATLNCHPEGVLVQRWWPHATDPEKMIYHYQVWALTDCELPNFMAIPEGVDRTGKTTLPATWLAPGDIEPLGPVVRQDAPFIPLVQGRMRSEGFRGAIYGEQELRIRLFYDEYYSYMSN